MDNDVLADDLELLALQDAAVSLEVRHLLVAAAAAIRAQSHEIEILTRERDHLLAELKR